ncbi:nickel/cobalt transporter [Vibrio nitrifigilis]|uniref:Nickel/cobalt efflux system n=1 Tax=Vibrio nitrifigilis TaxID=2789781 RepID=A0ABS0GGG8_9VIBR|nr:nickel/cobalt transporter [Vibrio nitrifigilis]MBF9001503.1 nickel/cobalt transporter [Vibrio nitrifigilis]
MSSTHHAHHVDPQTKKRYLTPARVVTLCVVSVTLIVILHLLYQLWPQILMFSIHWQRNTVDELSQLIYSSVQSHQAMYSLIEISFLYGIFHSIGPGHGKLIVSSYLSTNPTKINTGLVITVVSAFVQAIVAIAIVSIFLFVMHLTMRHVNHFVGEIFNVSYLGVLIIGIVIFIQGAKYFWQHRGGAHSHNAPPHEHHHVDENGLCSCGHKHTATPDELNQATSMKEYVAIIMSIGVRPCTGAILVLFFAELAHQYWIGIFSALLMALGTACTTSTIALLTVSGRKIMQKYMRDEHHSHPWIAPAVRLISGTALVFVAYVMFHQSGFGMSPVFNVHSKGLF